ncbi:unnamed protein product, partial [Lampetra planeri]
RPTDTHRDPQTHTETHRHAHRPREEHRDSQTHTETHRHAQKPTDAHIDPERSTETHRHTQRPTDTHRDPQTHTETHRRAQRPTHGSKLLRSKVLLSPLGGVGRVHDPTRERETGASRQGPGLRLGPLAPGSCVPCGFRLSSNTNLPKSIVLQSGQLQIKIK